MYKRKSVMEKTYFLLSHDLFPYAYAISYVSAVMLYKGGRESQKGWVLQFYIRKMKKIEISGTKGLCRNKNKKKLYRIYVLIYV